MSFKKMISKSFLMFTEKKNTKPKEALEKYIQETYFWLAYIVLVYVWLSLAIAEVT